MNLMRHFMLGFVLLASGCGPGGSSRSHVAQSTPTVQTIKPAASASAVKIPDKPPVPDKPKDAGEKPDESVEVARGALGHRVLMRAPKDFEVVDASNVRILSLGDINRAAFDRLGKLLYAWSDTTGTLYDIGAAKKLSERTKKPSDGAGFSLDGQRIIEVGEGVRFMTVPDLKITFEIEGGHSELHQTAHRAFTIKDVGGPKSPLGYELRLMLIDIDKEKVIGSLSMNEAMMRAPNIAFSADGKKMSMSLAGTRVWDTTTNKVIVLEDGEMPEHPRYEPGPAIFSKDGNSECVEQMGSIRTISIFNVPKGTKRHCFIRGRPEWSAQISQNDYEARIVDIPFAKGTVQPLGTFGLYYRVITEAMNTKGDLVAVIEQKDTKNSSDLVDTWLLLADAQTGRIKHRIVLPQMSYDTHQFEVAFSLDDKSVHVWNGDTEKVNYFDVETGNAMDTPKDWTPPEE